MRTGIRIDNLKPGSKGAICFADVTVTLEFPEKAPIDLVTINECSLRDGDKGQWLALPRRSWTGSDGETRWVKQVTLPDHTYRAAFTALQFAWTRYSPETPAAATEPESSPFE